MIKVAYNLWWTICVSCLKNKLWQSVFLTRWSGVCSALQYAPQKCFKVKLLRSHRCKIKKKRNERKLIRRTSSVSDISKERSEKFMRSIPQHVGVKNDELFNGLSKPYHIVAYFACTPSIQRKLNVDINFAIKTVLPEQKLCACFRVIFHLFLELNSCNEI